VIDLRRWTWENIAFEETRDQPRVANIGILGVPGGKIVISSASINLQCISRDIIDQLMLQ